MGDDAELAELRRQRMMQMQQQQMAEQEQLQRQQQMQAQIQSVLMQVMEPAARERLNTIRSTKPEFAASIEQQIAGKMDKVTLSAVATSGSYNDLKDKPTIPSEQVNADWNATSGKAQILNKPTIPAAVTE